MFCIDYIFFALFGLLSYNLAQHILHNVLHAEEPLSYHMYSKKVQVGKDQEKAQSERDSHSKNRGGKKPN